MTINKGTAVFMEEYECVLACLFLALTCAYIYVSSVRVQIAIGIFLFFLKAGKY